MFICFPYIPIIGIAANKQKLKKWMNKDDRWDLVELSRNETEDSDILERAGIQVTGIWRTFLKALFHFWHLCVYYQDGIKYPTKITESKVEV